MNVEFTKPTAPEAVARRAHPAWAVFGLRPATSQHSAPEDALLRELASSADVLVELGVAEGGAAARMLEVMRPGAVAYLVDPYFSGRLPVAMPKLVARRLLRGHRAQVRWMEALSWDAAAAYDGPPVDFLFVDADHSEEAVERDWHSWLPRLSSGAVVGFHDSRVFPGGWTAEDWGPVRFVNRAFRSTDSAWRVVREVDSIVVVART